MIRWLPCSCRALYWPVGALASPNQSPKKFSRSDRLEKLVRDTVAAAVEQFGKGGLTADKIAVTMIDLRTASVPSGRAIAGRS